MKKLMLAAAAVLAVSGSFSAYAAPPKTPKAHAAAAKAAHEETTSGAISAISASELKLATGQVFKFTPTGAGPGSFKAGDKVNVKWTRKDGAMVVDHLDAAK